MCPFGAENTTDEDTGLVLCEDSKVTQSDVWFDVFDAKRRMHIGKKNAQY